MEKLTPEQLKNTLGEYVAPEGLYEKTRDIPFLGRVSCNINKLVAGSWEEIIIDYEVGASGIADGAWLKATFKFYSDWALFQTSDPTAANYISAEYQAGPLAKGQTPATVQSLKIRFDQKGHERPFQKAVIIDTIDGYLNPGDHIIIRLGDRRQGGPGTRVQTFVESGFRFRCYVDPLGTSRFAPIPGDISIDIVPGEPANLRISAPRITQPGQTPKVIAAIEDRWGNTCWDLKTDIAFTAVQNNLPIYESNKSSQEQGWSTASITDLTPAQVGEISLRAELKDYPAVPMCEEYITVDDNINFPRAFYGDLHVHSDDTVGTNDTVYNLTYGRDVSALDVLGYTANDFNITQQRWEQAVNLINELNQPGEFVCYPGTEWCGNSCAGGDHNVVFLRDATPEFPFDKNGNVCRSFEWNEDMNVDTIQPGAWPLEELYATYIHDPEGHLLIPHVGGRRCNLDWHHPVLERLAEVESAWGHFPWLYEDAMRRGYKLGVSANSDEHRGRCGGGVPGSAVFGTKGGLTGIIANTLDRQSIGQALRARHTFATTGERLFAHTQCDQHIMGDEFQHNGNARIHYRFLGNKGWDNIAAYDHSGCFWQRNLQQENEFSSRAIRLCWGGARIKDRYRWAAWQGTISIRNGIINRFAAHGFEHPEETCWRENTTTLGFKSDTFGDTDCIEINVDNLQHAIIQVSATIDGYVKVGNPLDGNRFAHSPGIEFEINGKDLLNSQDGCIRHELGGAGLFLALERISENAMPRDVSGVLEVEAENGPLGFKPIYLIGTQIDGAKVWTSAMFIQFS
ncbi:MAG: hypothetical protein R3240_04930 [Gammaproteobacteria bacterium]|nr:hypothetical protein [Gammaproteobacteria bacterium]